MIYDTKSYPGGVYGLVLRTSINQMCTLPIKYIISQMIVFEMNIAVLTHWGASDTYIH